MKNMWKIGKLAVFFLVVVSCSKKIETEDLVQMNGYWEIDKVVFSNGTEKEYSVNEMYDFFQLKEGKGFRKKVKPLLNGTFLVNADAEQVSIKKDKDRFKVHYTTLYSQWDEELIELSSEEMILRNENNTEYHYKRAAPINILKDGKTTK